MSRDDLLPELYRQMYLIRRFEETLLDMFSAGLLVGTTHTCIGQEADAVGVIAHLDPDVDVVFSNHRCHGHYIVFTGDVVGLLAEVMGRRSGVCGGKGGSQHLCRGNFYTNGVQGGIVPVATGIAMAEKRAGSGAVTVVYVGDGTLGQGALYESLNMASLWSLPLLVVVENNKYAQSTPTALAVAGDVAGRAAGFGIEAETLVADDVLAVHEAGARAVARVRASGRPFVLDLDTYRLSPHSKGDDTRDPAEVEDRRGRDALARAAAALPEDARAAIEADCERELAAARAAAEEAPIAAPAVAP